MVINMGKVLDYQNGLNHKIPSFGAGQSVLSPGASCELHMFSLLHGNGDCKVTELRDIHSGAYWLPEAHDKLTWKNKFQ